MEFIETKFDGCFQLKLDVFADNRGSFVKVYSRPAFAPKDLSLDFHEIFYSISKKGVVRGMHFQNPPFDQAKLVNVMEGEIIDVIVDLRKSSPTFQQYEAFELRASRGDALYIPKGFAHGFQALTDMAMVAYGVNSAYSPQHDRGIRYDSFGYKWPLPPSVVSERDLKHPGMQEFQSLF